MEKDSVNDAHMIEYFAIITAWMGEKEPPANRSQKRSDYWVTVPSFTAKGNCTILGPARRRPAFGKNRRLARAERRKIRWNAIFERVDKTYAASPHILNILTILARRDCRSYI